MFDTIFGMPAHPLMVHAPRVDSAFPTPKPSGSVSVKVTFGAICDPPFLTWNTYANNEPALGPPLVENPVTCTSVGAAAGASL